MGQEGLIPPIMRYMAILFLSKTNVVEYLLFIVEKGPSKNSRKLLLLPSRQ